jgi:enamine deaminase RidA (YjgF/YER057c/UK114 family)
MFGRLAAILKEHDASVVWQEVFGYTEACGEGLQHLRKSFGEVNWPITWVEGASCTGGPLAGIHAFAVAGVPVTTVCLDDRPVGRLYSDGLARHCLLGDIRPANAALPQADQTREVYARLEAGLEAGGMRFKDVMRTWFFLDDILSWYGHFNVVRNEFYRSGKVSRNLIPASTGISGKNRAGSALTVSAWAAQSISPAMQLREVSSPLQCPAPKYGSGFSRAVEFLSPDHRRMLVSGTASINPDGTSGRDGDIAGQIELTMDVIGQMLASRDMSFTDVTRCTAYLKQPAYATAMAKWCSDQGLHSFPIVMAEASVCRDELLVEVELDALVTLQPK